MNKKEKIGYVVEGILDIEMLIIQCFFNYFFEDSVSKEKRSFFILNLQYSIPASDKLKIFQALEDKLKIKIDDKFHNDIKRLIEIRNIVCHSIPTFGKFGSGLIEKKQLRSFIDGNAGATEFKELFNEFKEKYERVRPSLIKYADIDGNKIKAKEIDKLMLEKGRSNI